MSRKPISQLSPGRLRWLALLIGLGCIAWGCDSKQSSGGKLKPVKSEGDPVILTTKGDVPYVTVYLADEISAIKQGDSAAREEALIRKALLVVVERAVGHEKYAGKDRFQVNLLVLHELDEYGKAKTGSSLNLATIEVPRTAVEALKVADVPGLSGPDLRKRVASATFNLGNLDKFE
jgi:hypothetical protein